MSRIEDLGSRIEIVGNPARAFSRGINMKVIECALAAHVDWHLGYPDRALGISQETIKIARQLDHPLSLAMALDYAAMLHQFRREPSEVRDHANAAVAICIEHEFAYYRAWATILLGWATAEQGKSSDTNYLFENVIARLMRGPVQWHLIVTIASRAM